MQLDMKRVIANVRAATTEDLLDRATIYREGMEPEALVVIDQELRDRGVSDQELAAHSARREEEAIRDRDGLAVRCSRCDRPAVIKRWVIHRLWGVVPLFPRWQAFCAEHQLQGARQQESV